MDRGKFGVSVPRYDFSVVYGGVCVCVYVEYIGRIACRLKELSLNYRSPYSICRGTAEKPLSKSRTMTGRTKAE